MVSLLGAQQQDRLSKKRLMANHLAADTFVAGAHTLSANLLVETSMRKLQSGAWLLICVIAAFDSLVSAGHCIARMAGCLRATGAIGLNNKLQANRSWQNR